MAPSRSIVSKPSVGIDLGTTYSCVAVFQNGRPEVIANSQGNRITPSVVAFTKEGRLIGEGAEIQRKLDPPNAIYNVKKFIGRTWDDPAVQANCLAYPFKVLDRNNKIQFQVQNGHETVNLTPEEITADILGNMKEMAEDYVKEKVEDVVITVPAYFTELQRQATINAGKIAGLNVTSIIDEPTSAAMAYGLGDVTNEDEDKHVLVYDLGGGTFDVSVLEIKGDLIQVKATGGNSNLGEDFNQILVTYFKKEIFRKYKFDLTSNFKTTRRLEVACEKLKSNLSADNVKESKVELDNFLPGGKDFVATLTRAKFENLCKERFEETIKYVEIALKDAHLSKRDINEIVLVGGSSRIPKLQSMLGAFFNKTLNKSINPDEAVACGAAVQAEIINKQKINDENVMGNKTQSTPRGGKSSVSVGIDLGTTYSCVAVFQNGRPEVIANSQGNRITPSVVAFTKEGRLIGERAEIQSKFDPPNAIYNAKRFIGRSWDDPAVQANSSMYPFKVVEKNKNIQFEVKSGPKTINLTPEEIAAAILGKMKKTAEDYLEQTVEDAVITVPAYFNDSQRQATVNGGLIAGLNVTRIINEPTAAAMAYGLKEGTSEDEGKHILVYDLGGGTFDVSVLEIEDDLIQVKATAGNTNLGGEDFNDLLVNHFKQEIIRKHSFDLTSNCKGISRLKRACEKIKRNLSAENVTESELELDNFLPDGQDFVSNLTRAQFEKLCQKRFDETIKCVEQALEDAHLEKDDIDEIVLVGGSSRIPKLQSMLSELFKNKTLSKSINPDEAVACGAAVQAAIINNDPHISVKDLLLMDVLPLSIGENFVGEITHVILERNTSIPVRKTIMSSTASNYQTSASFEITEGERTMTKDNKILGVFYINGLEPKKAGEVHFETVYEMDENGILSVSATLVGTNKKAGITLDVRSAGKMSDKEVKRLVQEAEKMKMDDQKEENRVLAMNKLTSLCNHIAFVTQDLPKTDLGDVLHNVEDCLVWIREHPDANEGQFIAKYDALCNEAANLLNLSMKQNTERSNHVLRLGKQKAKYYLKEGRNLFLSTDLDDKIKAAEYFYKAYKIAYEAGKIFKEIESLLLCGHTYKVLAAAVTDTNEKLNYAIASLKCLTFVLDLEQNKSLSEEERKAVINDIQFVTDEFFKIIDNPEDEKKLLDLEACMLAIDNRNATKNSDFCHIVFQCRIKEIKLFLKRISINLAKEDFKDAQKLIQNLNYPKEQAKLLARSQKEKEQLAEVIDAIEESRLHAQGLNQIDLAINLLEKAEVDHPDTIDKALMALDHLSYAKQLTKEAHPQVYIKAVFFEGKIFMDYISNMPKAKSCFEKLVTVSKQSLLNTDEYRESKYILEQMQEEQLQEDERFPSVSRETVMYELRHDFQKIKQSDESMSDEKFIEFLFTEYPPKHKENYKKPVITSSGAKKKAYIRLSMFYHPDKVDASQYGEKYKALCGEISKYVNGRFMKM